MKAVIEVEFSDVEACVRASEDIKAFLDMWKEDDFWPYNEIVSFSAHIEGQGNSGLERGD